jgi:hypothetical protein
MTYEVNQVIVWGSCHVYDIYSNLVCMYVCVCPYCRGEASI